MKKVTIKWNKRLDYGHQWIFSNEVISSFSHYEKGELVRIHDHQGRFRAVGYINPNSLIAIRILSRQDEDINKHFIERKIDNALNYRHAVGVSKYDSYRLVYGEADGLSGLIVDIYKDYLSVQLLTVGIERLFPVIKDVLLERFLPKAIVVRNDTSIRELEGLPLYKDVVYGSVDEMPVIQEDGVSYRVDILEGQKTGFFLDQRSNRLFLRKLICEDREIKAIDCFSYSGGWALSAMFKKNNLDILAVDISEKALGLVRENATLNNVKVNTLKTDVFHFLRSKRQEDERYDLIILDPPAFIKSKAKIKEGVKGYKEINLSAMKLLSKEGILVTSSCSHHLSREMFLQLLQEAAADCNKQFKIIKMAGQAEDHPVLLSMKETDYLKTYFLKIA